jgi:hypothetical protein
LHRWIGVAILTWSPGANVELWYDAGMDYNELRTGLGKDAAKTLFALFIGLPALITAFVFFTPLIGGLYTFFGVVAVCLAIAAYRNDQK